MTRETHFKAKFQNSIFANQKPEQSFFEEIPKVRYQSKGKVRKRKLPQRCLTRKLFSAN